MFYIIAIPRLSSNSMVRLGWAWQRKTVMSCLRVVLKVNTNNYKSGLGG